MDCINNINMFFNIISSSSESDSDIDVPERERIPRVQHFIETVVDQYSEAEFRRHFRMYRTTFNYLLNLIKDNISTDGNAIGRHTISAKTQLLLSLWYFATPDTYRSICTKFNVGYATAHRAVRRVTDALCSISMDAIRWPSDDSLENIIRGFQNMGFPNTIGCIDGSYIPIPLPKDNGRSYICRKNFPAIILQGVCDHRLLFTHCYAGEVGSNHDAVVLKRSEIWRYMESAEKFPNDTHLIGDKAYPLTPQLLTPYRNNGHLTPAQMNYNYRLAATRNTIERAFGLLKKRLRCMKFLDARNMEWIPKYIIACCVLHNICILQNDIIEYEHQDQEEDDDDNFVIPRDEHALRRRQGQLKRERICAEFV